MFRATPRMKKWLAPPGGKILKSRVLSDGCEGGREASRASGDALSNYERASERVVSGARHVSPSLGDRMRAGQLAGHSVFIRELLPQDLTEIERLTRSETMKAAHYLAAVIGKAHARQMDATTRASWLADRETSIEGP
jgi:uncharacterized protein (DUF2252 family)